VWCIFCKATSDSSTSVEHIIPESLGNTTAILRAGVVCDPCNNYFARKIEKPVLDCRYFKDLRGRQQIDNKRGRVPSQLITVDHIGAGELLRGELFLPSRRHPEQMGVARFEADTDTVNHVVITRGARVFNTGSLGIERPDLMSRFLAKVALEFMTERCMNREEWEEFIIANTEFDPLRNHARRGNPALWPYSQRTIYGESHRFADNGGVQRVWEWTPFVARQDSDRHEVYSVLCIFGQEFAINCAGADLEGYEAWLDKHGKASPLYLDGLPSSHDTQIKS
jgi:hypothetical protein